MFERHFLPSSEESDQEACSVEEIPLKLPQIQRPASLDRKSMLESEKYKFFKPSHGVFNVNLNTDMLPIDLTIQKTTPVKKDRAESNSIEEITLKDLRLSQPCRSQKLLNNCFFEDLEKKENFTTPVKTPRELTFINSLVLGIVETALTTARAKVRRSSSRKQGQRAHLSAKSFVSYNILNFREILTSPVRKNMTFNCTIKRDRSGFKKIWGRYYLFLDEGWLFLLAACKRKWNRSPNYMITSKMNQFDKHSTGYMGKVRGNFMKKHYTVYDSGSNPKDKNATCVRKELVNVIYEYNETKAMKVVVPDGQEYVFDRGSFYADVKTRWNHPKAEVSAKNLQIVNEQDKTIVELVKVAENQYGLEINWPFSPLQAFGLALANLGKYN